MNLPVSTPRVLVESARSPAYTTSVEHVRSQFVDAGIPAELVSPDELREQLQAQLNAQDCAVGVLVIGSTALGPIGRLSDFLSHCDSSPALAISPQDIGADVVRANVPFVYLGPTVLRSKSVRALVEDHTRDVNTAALLEAVMHSDTKVEFLLGEDDRDSSQEESYLLRDRLLTRSLIPPFLPWEVFTLNPLALERWAVPSTSWANRVLEAGYPSRVFWETLLSAVDSSTWFYNTGQYRVLPDKNVSEDEGGKPIRRQVVISLTDPHSLSSLVNSASRVGPVQELYVVYSRELDVKSLRGDDVWSKEAVAKNISKIRYFAADPRLIRNGAAGLLAAKPQADESAKTDILLFLSDSLASLNPHAVGMTPWQQVLDNLTAGGLYQTGLQASFARNPELGLIFSPPPVGYGYESSRVHRTVVEEMRQLGKSARLQVPSTPTNIVPTGVMWWMRSALLDVLQPIMRDLYNKGLLTKMSVGDTLYAMAQTVFSSGHFARSAQTISSAEETSLLNGYRLDQLSQHLYPYASEAVDILQSRLTRRNG